MINIELIYVILFQSSFDTVFYLFIHVQYLLLFSIIYIIIYIIII